MFKNVIDKIEYFKNIIFLLSYCVVLVDEKKQISINGDFRAYIIGTILFY